MKHYHIVSRISIYLLSVIMIVFGIFHFLNPHDLLVYVPTSLPGGIIWAYFVGAAFILVGISFITNNFVKIAGYTLAGLLFIFIFFIHLPNYMEAGNKEMQTIALINVLNDAVIACFSMHLAAGVYSQHLHLDNSD